MVTRDVIETTTVAVPEASVQDEFLATTKIPIVTRQRDPILRKLNP